VLDPATAAEEKDEEKTLGAFKLTSPRWPCTKGGQDAETSLCLDDALPDRWNHPDQKSYARSPLEGHFKLMALNCGGKLKPWTKAGTYVAQNRLHTMTNLILAGEADIILAVEGHITNDVAHSIERFAREENCFATTAPTSMLMANMLDDTATTGKRTDPAAGIVAVMSNSMKSRLRGRPARSVSGRLLHLTFGDGANPTEDKVRTHVCACYGISGGSGMRKSIARALHEELDTILSNAEYAARGDHFIVYADVNAVGHGGGRATGETTSYDDDEHALWRALRSPAHGLQDLMAAAYAVPPMTYAPKNKPTSRIDLLFASGAIAANAHAATASALGSLSATHLPLACSFRDDGLAGKPQDLHSEGALDSAVAIMATVGGQRWAFGPAE
jgi:hypothetical protein